jgi:hypothetical protein
MFRVILGDFGGCICHRLERSRSAFRQLPTVERVVLNALKTGTDRRCFDLVTLQPYFVDL